MPETHRMAIIAPWQAKLFIYHHFRHWVIIDNQQYLYQTHSGSLEHSNFIGLFFSIHSGFFIYTVFYTVFPPWIIKVFQTVHPYEISTGISLLWYQSTCTPMRCVHPYEISTSISLLWYQSICTPMRAPLRDFYIDFSTKIPKYLRID